MEVLVPSLVVSSLDVGVVKGASVVLVIVYKVNILLTRDLKKGDKWSYIELNFLFFIVNLVTLYTMYMYHKPHIL